MTRYEYEDKNGDFFPLNATTDSRAKKEAKKYKDVKRIIALRESDGQRYTL